MHKNTICALLLGTSLLSCDTPAQKRADGSGVLYIPAECKDDVVVSGDHFWQVNCKDDKGKELYFRTASHHDTTWIKYEIERR